MSIGVDVQNFIKMTLLWLIFSVVPLLFLFYKFTKSSSNEKNKAGRHSWIIISSIYNFIFKVKSEDRLNAFKQIHKFFPRYTRIKIFNLVDQIVIYDPEICKKVFNAQTACQRPFRNCLQLENGLLSSECKFFDDPSWSMIDLKWTMKNDELWTVCKIVANKFFNHKCRLETRRRLATVWCKSS